MDFLRRNWLAAVFLLLGIIVEVKRQDVLPNLTTWLPELPTPFNYTMLIGIILLAFAGLTFWQTFKPVVKPADDRTANMPIRDLFFHMDRDVLREPGKVGRWTEAGTDLMD